MVSDCREKDKKIKYKHFIHRSKEVETLDKCVNDLAEKGYIVKSTSAVLNSGLKTYEFVILTEYQEN